MNRAILTVIGLGFALGGCQPAPPSTPPEATMPAMTSGTSDPEATSASISGHALYRERMLMPPGSRLTVQLIDNLLADTPKAVIAETTVTDAGAPPIAFSLPYESDAIRPNGQYGLHASLYDAKGRLMFVTDTRHMVTPGSNETVELLMKRVGGAARPTADPETNSPGQH